MWARWIDARLRKRYATPFSAHDGSPPTPVTLQVWLARIVTVQVMVKRGVDPSDAQFELIRQSATTAMDEVAEAANSESGWFDLPVRTESDRSAISRGGPQGYAEQSPYVWMDKQAEVGRAEDAAGRGRGVPT